MNTESVVNIGDYIQALAASQFLPRIDGFVQREKLNEPSDSNCAVIMNGWYMFNTENWPPSDSINPLFVAFHINSSAQNELLADDSIKYLKKHEPIGCRDKRTMNLLLKKGVDAYFSGCLTLTLGETYTKSSHTDKVYFVDPYFRIDESLWKFRFLSVFRSIKDYRSLKTLACKFYDTKKPSLKQIFYMGYFLKVYGRLFSKKMLLDAEYVNQQSKYIKDRYATDENLLQYARDLVDKYSEAACVVTSRIHCALPCLGLGTPVLYVDDDKQSEESKCRMEGLIELFNVVKWDNGSLIPDFQVEGHLTKGNFPANKTSWKLLAENLKERCKGFVKLNMMKE